MKYLPEIAARYFCTINEVPLGSLSLDDAQRLYDHIDIKLEPENISCDGERSRADVKRHTTILVGAQKELLQIAKANGYSINRDNSDWCVTQARAMRP